MSALGRLVVSIALEHAQYTQGLDKSDQAALKFAHNAQRNFDQASASVKDFMKGAVAQAAAAVGAMVAVNESFTRSLEFSKSIAQISTQLDGSIDDLNRLEAAAKNMSVQFGTLPVDQSRAFYEIISAGTTDVTKATELLAAANKLAIGGATDLATSVDGLTNIMNSYSGKVESADAVSDALFVGMKAGKATMEELSSSLGKVTPIAASLNVSFDELVATVSALSKQGISTTESVTGVRAILASVAKPTKEAKELAADLGLEFNAAGLQAKGFAGFLDDISKKTGGSVDKLALIFGGVEALIPIMALSGQAGQDFTQIMQEMGNKAGSTQDAFDKMAASPGFKIDQLMASVNNIAITLGDSLASVLAPAAEKASRAINELFGINKSLSAIDQQKQKVSELKSQLESLSDRKHIPVIGDLIFDKRQADLLEQRIDDGIADIKRLEEEASAAAKALSEVPKPPAITLPASGDGSGGGKAVDRALGKEISESQRFVQALMEESSELGRNRFEVLRVQAAKHGLSQSYIDVIDNMERESNASKKLKDDLERAKNITNSVATQQDRYNQTLEELNRLKPYLSVEAYTRALEKAQKELQDTGKINKFVVSEMDQMWIQAGRNIQSSLSNSIFDFFDGGLDDMVRNVKTAVLRMAAEFAALKIAQNTGLADMFIAGGVGGTGGAAGTGWNMGGGLLSAFSSGASGDRLGGFINGGYTANAARVSTVGSLFSNTNLGYGALALGASSAAGTSNITTGIATAMATFGGPYGMLAAAVVIALDILNKKFGDYTISDGFKPLATTAKLMSSPMAMNEMGVNAFEKAIGTGFVSKTQPGYFVENILGVKTPETLIANALFGRGQFKLQNQQFQANIGADGIQSGALIESYKAKGSVFRGSRTDNIIIDALSGDLINKFGDIVESGISSVLKPIADFRVDAAHGFTEIINDALSGIGDSMRDVAKNLSIGTAGLESFSTQLTIVSEKGKTITQEDFSAEIARITDQMVLSLFPAITEFANRGETASVAFARLNTEFVSLVGSVQNLGGSFAFSKQLISGMSIDERSDLVDAAGGVDRLGQLTSTFFDGFLTNGEKLAVKTDILNNALSDLGLSTDLTRDQFKALVQSTDTANDLRLSLLELVPAFLEVRIATDQLRGATELINNIGPAFSELQKSIGAERTRITNDYNAAVKTSAERIRGVTESISKLKSLSDALKSTVDSILPLTRDQAKQQIFDAINTAKRGGALPDADSLRDALGVLGNSDSITGVTSSFEFALEQAKTANLLGDLGNLTDSQLTLEQRSLAALEAQRDRLDAGFDGQIDRLDSMLEQGQREIDTLNGLNTAVLALTQAIGNFNLRIAQAGGTPITDPLTGLAPVPGNPKIKDKEIIDYFSVPRTPAEIARDARANGVTSEQIIATGRFTRADADKFFRDNPNIPRFASGGSHRGGLRIVGERGPELESTGPANITSNSDLRKLLNNDDVVGALKQLLNETKEMKAFSLRTAKILESVTQNGTTLRTKTA